jgi:uroporphyrinogen-III synthase
VLLARADIAPEGLESAIEAKGWTVARVEAYRTRMTKRLPPDVSSALRTGGVDAVTFTSASTVEGFVRMTTSGRGSDLRLPPAVCLGPVTSAAARAAGMRVAAVARPHTIDGLVAAVERALRPRRRKEP